MINHEFARMAEKARLQKDLTQKSLAEHADISIRQYQNIINNGADPSLSNAVRLAAVLGISLDKLVQSVQPDVSDVYRNPHKSA